MAYYTGGHICQCLTQLCTLRRHSTVTISGDRRMTGEQFVKRVLGLARGLRQLGLKPGDVVAIAAFNSDQYLEWLLAVAYIGGISAPLNYRWNFEEARSAMEVVNAVMLVTDESCSHWYSVFLTNPILHIRWHVTMWFRADFKLAENFLTTEELQKSPGMSLSISYSFATEAVALICFTSGTTGKPKGVSISHSALIIQSLAKISIVGYSEDDVYLHTAPLCHIGGISSAMAMLMIGACHVIPPKFEANLAYDAIEKHAVTSLITVPAMMVDMVSVIREKEIQKGKRGLNTLIRILNGGGALSAKLINEARKSFPRAKLLSAYGMTEACSSLTFMTLYDPRHGNSDQPFHLISTICSSLVHQPEGVCVGKPAPHVELRISYEESSRVGRILTRGPHLMLGYWGQNLAKTSDPLEEGWLDTGDIGHIDEFGNVWLVGRANGRIKSGGENVYPEEVESVLSQHPGVSGIVVVGVPDARLTEIVVACCLLKDTCLWMKDPMVMTKQECLSSSILREYCKQKNLSGFKIPKHFVVWRKPFPVTVTGKLRRDQVRREIMSGLSLNCLPSNL